MTAQVDTIASQLPLMNSDDIAKIRKLTEMLLGQNSVTQPNDDEEARLFNALKAELESIGHGSVNYTMFQNMRHFKTWRKNYKTFIDFVDDNFKNEIKSDTHRLALYRFLIKTLIADLRRREIPAGPGTLASNIHNIAIAFDNAFPGYLETGLAVLVPRKLLAKT